MDEDSLSLEARPPGCRHARRRTPCAGRGARTRPRAVSESCPSLRAESGGVEGERGGEPRASACQCARGSLSLPRLGVLHGRGFEPARRLAPLVGNAPADARRIGARGSQAQTTGASFRIGGDTDPVRAWIRCESPTDALRGPGSLASRELGLIGGRPSSLRSL